MREAAFVKQKTRKWDSFEKMLSTGNQHDPDMMADLFVQLTDDLAYSKTHYPNSNTTQYLNNLTSKVHQHIYRNKKEDKSRFVTFWKYELPCLMFEKRKQLLYAFLLFVIPVVIGALSSAHDNTFVRLILGDQYINMTLSNIEKGDPMAVYKSTKGVDMFYAITFNNVRVSFLAFAMGILLSVGTAILLFYNGVMLGAFQYFFYQKGLFFTSFLTIWVHGTLEISAIIIAGAAGLVMGNSILFPGTFTRAESFKRGAKIGVKMAIGLVPVFIMAGFLESFITRLTGLHWIVKLGIIAVSASFIVYYFVIYPYNLHRNDINTKNQPSGAT